MKNCLIISGGDFSSLPANRKFDYVIACDQGILHAKKLGLRPDLILGDFDSLKEPIPTEYEGIMVKKYPIVKDDSDTMLAARIAVEKGFEKVTIVCALGGRLDHSFANLQTLAFLAKSGCIGELYSDDSYVITHTGGELKLPKREGFSLSLFAASDLCEDICITGSAYDVSHATLTNTFPLGLSNYWKEDVITISMKKGILFIMEARYKSSC